MSKTKILMNKADLLKALITPMVVAAFGQYLSSTFVNKERLEQVRKIHENMIYVNAIMEVATEDEEAAKAGDQPLVDWMYTESEYLVTRYKHLLSKADLKAADKKVKAFRKEAEKLEKKTILEVSKGGKS